MVQLLLLFVCHCVSVDPHQKVQSSDVTCCFMLHAPLRFGVKVTSQLKCLSLSESKQNV